MSVYPTGIDSFTTKVDGVDDVLAEYINDLQDSVVAIENTLGSGTTNFVSKAGDTMTGGLNFSSGSTVYFAISGQSIALGDGAHNYDINSIAIGSNATTSGLNCVAIGPNAVAGGEGCFVVNSSRGGYTRSTPNAMFLNFPGDIFLADGTNLYTEGDSTADIGTELNPFGSIYASGTVYAQNIVCPTLPTRATRYMEQPSGTVDGNNQSFTLSNAPYDNSLLLYKNGLLMIPSGVSNVTFDFTLVGNTITYEVAPSSGALHMAARYEY